MHEIQRRALLKGAAAGTLAFSVDGADVLLTPRAQDVPLRTLSPAQAETLDAVGETLVPGARQAGISHFVDQQISIPAEQALLQARILNVRPPYANFYRAALAALNGASERLNGGRATHSKAGCFPELVFGRICLDQRQRLFCSRTFGWPRPRHVRSSSSLSTEQRQWPPSDMAGRRSDQSHPKAVGRGADEGRQRRGS